MNRSGNGQNRQPQKVSRSADDVGFIKPSEKLARDRFCPSLSGYGCAATVYAVTHERMFSVGVDHNKSRMRIGLSFYHCRSCPADDTANETTQSRCGASASTDARNPARC